jgi:hypothetical protein
MFRLETDSDNLPGDPTQQGGEYPDRQTDVPGNRNRLAGRTILAE